MQYQSHVNVRGKSIWLYVHIYIYIYESRMLQTHFFFFLITNFWVSQLLVMGTTHVHGLARADYSIGKQFSCLRPSNF